MQRGLSDSFTDKYTSVACVIVANPSFFLSTENRFDAVVSADAFENLKPAPDIFLAAAKNLNVPPSEVQSFYFF